MFGRSHAQPRSNGQAKAEAPPAAPVILLAVAGERARRHGTFEIAESIQVECEVGGELSAGGRLVIGEKGAVAADVRTVDAVIMGRYEGNMVATGTVEIAATGRVTGSIETDSLVISHGGFFNGSVSKVRAEGPRAVHLVEERRPGPPR